MRRYMSDLWAEASANSPQVRDIFEYMHKWYDTKKFNYLIKSMQLAT